MAHSYCDRCGGTFVDHAFYGWNCVGCVRRPVLFELTVIELRPYDYPVTRIIGENPVPDDPLYSGSLPSRVTLW